MQQIFSYFWKICLLRAGPEQLPNSVFVLGFTTVVYFLLSLLTVWITENVTPVVTVAGVMIGIGVEASILYCLLLYKQVRQRFISTLAALLGTTSVILLIMLPANLVFAYTDTPTMRVIAGVLFFSTFVWRLAISGSILRYAARVSLLQGAAIMFGMQMIALWLNRSLLPSPG